MTNTTFLLTLFFLSFQSQASSYFPENYTESRDRLLSTIKDLKNQYGKELESFQLKVPSRIDDDLSIDGFYLDCSKNSSKPSKLLLLTSGVHGPESYVGAGAQHWFIRNALKTKCTQGLSVLLFHAINPYGFKYGRRFNEDNIDLNRNFPTSPELYLTENQAYHDLEDILNPKKPVGPLALRSASLFTKLIKRLVGGLSVSSIRQASVGGQYDVPKGIYYGGEEPAVQTHLLTPLLKNYLNQHDKVLHFDFHTGLGEPGVLHLITGPGLGTYGENLLEDIFRKYEPSRFDITHPNDPGFYEVGGDFVDYVPKLKKNGKILGLTVEYGTVGLGLFPQLKTLTRLVNENQGHHHGYKNKRIEKRVKRRLRELFQPKEKKWQDQVKKTNSFLLTTIIDEFLNS